MTLVSYRYKEEEPGKYLHTTQESDSILQQPGIEISPDYKTPSILSSETGAQVATTDLNKLNQITAPTPTTPTPTPAQTTAEKETQRIEQARQTQLSQGGIEKSTFESLVGTDTTGYRYNAETGLYMPEGGVSPVATGVQDYNNLIDSSTQSTISSLNAMSAKVDKSTQDLISSINQKYEARSNEMKDINLRRQKQFETYGIRSGAARYAESVSGGILAAEERAGVQRLSEIDAEMTSLISQAQSAADSKQFDILSQKIGLYEKRREERNRQIEDLNKLAIEEAKKLQESKVAFSRENAIVNVFSQGIADPTKVFQILNYDEKGNQIGDITMKEITDILEKSMPKETEILSLDEATKLGVPYGTTKVEAYGITPKTGINLSGEAKDFQSFIDLGLIDTTKTIQEQFKQYLNYKSTDEILSVAEADKLGVAFGTTKSQAYGLIPKKDTSGLDARLMTQVDKISESFDNAPIVKQFNEVQNKLISFSSIINRELGGPGDLAMVFEFMKALDPTSVVREQEYANASQAGNIFAGTLARFNGYLKPEGGFLPDNVKEAFLDIVRQKYQAVEQQYDNLYIEKGRLIDRKTSETDGTDYLINYKQVGIDNIAKKSQENYIIQTPKGSIDLTKFEK